MAAALNIQTGPPRQRYYPQCTSCMQKQASAIRNDKVGAGGRWVVLRLALLHWPAACRVRQCFCRQASDG